MECPGKPGRVRTDKQDDLEFFGKKGIFVITGCPGCEIIHVKASGNEKKFKNFQDEPVRRYPDGADRLFKG